MEVRCDAAEVPEGHSKQIIVEGRAPIAIYRVEGNFYATDDICTHGEASLCDGWLEGAIVECPFHAGKFDVRTGEAIEYPAVIPLRTYPVSVADGVITVTVE